MQIVSNHKMTDLAERIEREGVTLFHGMNWEFWSPSAPSSEPNAHNLLYFVRKNLDTYGLTHVELNEVPSGVYNTTKQMKAAYFAGPSVDSKDAAREVANRVFDDFLESHPIP